MSLLTSGRKEISCYDVIGGIRYVYLAEFIDYEYSEIVGEKGVSLESIPTAFIYKYSVVNASFNEVISHSDNGEIYDQSLIFDLKMQDRLTSNEIRRATNIDLRYIVEFNDGRFKIGGLYNGAIITQFDSVTGGLKSDFTGYKLTLESKELYSAAFIQDLTDAGFIVYEQPDGFCNYILQSDDNYILQNNDNYILNEACEQD